MFGLGFEQRYATVWLWTSVSSFGECQIPLTENPRLPCKNLALHIHANSPNTSRWLRWKDATDGSVQPGWAEHAKSGFYLNYHCRAVKCDNKYLSYHIGQSLGFSVITAKVKANKQTKLPSSKESFPNGKCGVPCCGTEDLALLCQHYRLTAFVLNTG